MARTFSMDTTVDPPSLLARARRVAKDKGATLVGSEESGRFSHQMLTGRIPYSGTDANRHHNRQALAGALACCRVPAEKARSVVPLYREPEIGVREAREKTEQGRISLVFASLPCAALPLG